MVKPVQNTRTHSSNDQVYIRPVRRIAIRWNVFMVAEFIGRLQVNREINCSRHTRSLCRTHTLRPWKFFGTFFGGFHSHTVRLHTNAWPFAVSSIAMQTNKFVGALGSTQLKTTHTHTHTNTKWQRDQTTKNITTFIHIHVFAVYCLIKVYSFDIFQLSVMSFFDVVLQLSNNRLNCAVLCFALPSKGKMKPTTEHDTTNNI